MDSIISETDFEDFNDGKYIFFGGISRTKNNYGWYRGEKLNEWIGTLI
jgi:NTE family protein